MFCLFKNRKIFVLVLLALVFACTNSTALAASNLAELRAEIDALLLKLQAPEPMSASCAVPQASLAVGSRSGEVKKLQVWLNANGYPVGVTGKEGEYFGELTRAAVAKFQSAAGIRPATGFYGPITMSLVRERCAGKVENVGLEVNLSRETPESVAVARGATHVPVLAVDVSGTSVLHSLTLHHYGTGPATGFSKVYLYDGEVRLTPGVAVDDKTGNAVFADMNLLIDGEQTLTVVADFSDTDSANKDGFEIVSETSASADGVVVGSFPIQGELFTRVDATVGSLTIERSGTLKNPTIGSSASKVAEFKLTPSMREDVALRSMTLKNAGDIDPALISNFVLKQAGKTLSTASAINARGQIILPLSEELVLTGGTGLVFELFADISATAMVSDSLRIYLESASDIYAVGGASHQGVRVVSTQYNNSGANGLDASWSSVSGGVVTVMFQGPSVVNYVVGQNDIELMRFDVTARTNVEIRRLRFTLTAGGSDAAGTLLTSGGLCNMAVANYADIKLVDMTTGQVLASQSLDTECATGDQDNERSFVVADYWTIGAGQTRTVKLTADTGKFVPAVGETIRSTLVAFRDGDVRNATTGFFVPAADIVPSGNIVGATHNVHASQLMASLAAALAPTSAN